MTANVVDCKMCWKEDYSGGWFYNQCKKHLKDSFYYTLADFSKG